MCDCLAWHHPLWALVARRAGVKPGVVWSIFSALREEDPILARLSPKDQVQTLAIGLGFKPADVALVVASLQHSGVVDDDLNLTEAWHLNRTLDAKPDALPDALSENRTLGPQKPDASTSRRVLSANLSSQRSRRKYWRDKAVVEAASENRTPVRPDAPSLSFFPEQSDKKEQKQTRARVEDTDAGFAELRSLWPVSNRMTEAEQEYRRARRFHGAAEILDAARAYLDTKPHWQTPLFLMNWLRTDPCRDPVLPLSTPLREVATAEAAPPRPTRPDWVSRVTQLRATGVWPTDWGPPFGEPGCLVPPETGVAYSIARWFREHDQRMTG